MELKRHIVVACLDEAARRRVREALGARGHSFFMTNDRREALACVRQLEPSLVFAPAAHPSGNCYDFCRQVKETDRLTHVGVLVMGQAEDRYDLTAGLLAGVDDFIAYNLGADRLSEMALNLAEAMERKVPLRRRPPFRDQVGDAPATPAASPAPPPPSPSAPPPPKPKPESPPATRRDAPPQTAGDPFRDFFDEAARPGPPPPAPPEPPPVADDRLDQISEAASEEIGQYIEQWVQFHYGRRVDESMKQDALRAIKPMARTIVQTSLKKLVEKK